MEAAQGVHFHAVVSVADGAVVMLDGGGQVAGEDLPCVVVQRQHGHLLGDDVPVVALPGDHGQAVGNHGHLQGVLGVILGLGGVHQAPAADQPQPGQPGVKGTHHSLLDIAVGYAIMIHENCIHR